MRQKTLSIAIPTWNSEETIRETLDSVLPQITSEVEVVVSDNASTDNTQEIISGYRKKHEITYSRNDANFGFDFNCDMAVRKSSGRFVWLLSDNDTIAEGGVSKVLDVVSHYPDVSAVFVNSFNCVDIESVGGFCFTGDEFFLNSRFKSGLVSNNIVRRDRWLSIGVSKYFGSGWIHVGFLIEALSNGCGFVVSSNTVRKGKSKPKWGCNGGFIYAGFKFIELVKSMKHFGYGDEVIRLGVSAVEDGYVKYIPLAKSQGLKVDFDLFKAFYRSNRLLFFMWLPILLIPNVFFMLMKFIYDRIDWRYVSDKLTCAI